MPTEQSIVVSQPVSETSTPPPQAEAAPRCTAAGADEGFERFVEADAAGLSDDENQRNSESCTTCRAANDTGVLLPEGIGMRRLRWADMSEDDELEEGATSSSDSSAAPDAQATTPVPEEEPRSHRVSQQAPKPRAVHRHVTPQKPRPADEEVEVADEAAAPAPEEAPVADEYPTEQYYPEQGAYGHEQAYSSYGGYSYDYGYDYGYGYEQQPAVAPRQRRPSAHPKANPKVMCCYYKQKGWCKMGDKCWYSHDGPQDSDVPCHYGATCKAGHAHLSRTGNAAAARKPRSPEAVDSPNPEPVAEEEVEATQAVEEHQEHYSSVQNPYSESYPQYGNYGYDYAAYYGNYGYNAPQQRRQPKSYNHNPRPSRAAPTVLSELSCAYCGSSGCVYTQEYPVYEGNAVTRGTRAMCKACKRTYALN